MDRAETVSGVGGIMALGRHEQSQGRTVVAHCSLLTLPYCRVLNNCHEMIDSSRPPEE